jgi:uncharacterized protein YecE (DUF72 family)
MQLRVGTSGFAYKEWKGSFYPEKLKPADRLGYYAERLPAVEINNTFYRMPKKTVLESWAAEVPDHFRFAVKASRRITHFKRLKEVEEETGFLLGNLQALGAKLGVVLFQLPPNLKADLPRLERFLDLLDGGPRAVLEFRHPSWHEADVVECLRARGVALCLADSEEDAVEEIVATAPVGYLRLRRTSYAPGALGDWLRRVRATNWEEAFVFFKHEDAGAGPRLAGELLALAARGPAPVRPASDRARKAG